MILKLKLKSKSECYFGTSLPPVRTGQDWGGRTLRRTDVLWRKVLQALGTEGQSLEDTPGGAWDRRPPLLSARELLPKSKGPPGQDHIGGEVPSGGAGRTLTPRGSPGGRAGAEAPSRGGGKPDLIGKERSKGRLICPPGSALAPSGRRAGLLRGLCPLGGRGKGGRGLPARPRDPARLAPALEGQTFAPGRSEGS